MQIEHPNTAVLVYFLLKLWLIFSACCLFLEFYMFRFNSCWKELLRMIHTNKNQTELASTSEVSEWNSRTTWLNRSRPEFHEVSGWRACTASTKLNSGVLCNVIPECHFGCADYREFQTISLEKLVVELIQQSPCQFLTSSRWVSVHTDLVDRLSPTAAICHIGYRPPCPKSFSKR